MRRGTWAEAWEDVARSWYDATSSRAAKVMDGWALTHERAERTGSRRDRLAALVMDWAQAVANEEEALACDAWLASGEPTR